MGGFGAGGGFGLGGGNGGGQGSQSSDTLTIGGIAFLDEEHPEDISFELAQAWSIHVNVGGSKTAQALGPNPSDVTWTGKLFAQNLQPRFASLKALEVAAQQVQLTYLDQSYTVVVKKFTPKYSHRYLGEYTITVGVIADTSGQYTQTSPPGIDDQVGNVEQAAQTSLNQLAVVDPNGAAALQASWDLLFAELGLSGPLAQLTGPALQNLISLAGGVYESAQTYLANLGTSSANTSTPQFIGASQLLAYASLISKNLQAGQAPNVMVVQGGSVDLFDIASQVYSDPSLALPLANANGLITPVLSSGVTYTIVLPPSLQAQAAA
jgi:hypothetical protein